MIVVIGRLARGYAAPIARRVAQRGATVELVVTASPDAAGDRALAELASAGVGHAAVLRSAAPTLEPPEVELALRYLPDVRVVVLADPQADLEVAAADAAAWSGAALVALGDGERSSAAIRLGAPATDPDGAFAGVVADLATRLDGGEAAESAWRSTAAALGLERVSPRR